MFETITKHVRENSVVRFLLSHLIILLAALLICAVGFRSAFVIVRNDVLDSTMFAMTQAVSSVDNGLTELHTLGMQTARSENVKAIEEYIRKNYHNPNLGLAMVSAEFNLSEGYLSAIFKKETGTNFAEYLEQLRVKAACVLLQDGCKVSDLPERLGYNSIQSFRRAFKRVMGVSPSEYRG